jgi:hypothetical protein
MLEEKEFTERLWKLNKEGSPGVVLNYVREILAENKTTFDGHLITFDLIVDKYTKYLDYWKRTIGTQNQQYVKDKDKLKNISLFLVNSMYEHDFSLPSKRRDNYLFGNHSQEHLMSHLHSFLNIINNGRID